MNSRHTHTHTHTQTHLGVSAILIFVGIKISISELCEISVLVSLGVLVGILATSVMASVGIPKNRG